MATQTTISTRIERATAKPLLDGTRFDLLFSFGAIWYITGTFLDSWAHNNIPRLETFWTPWHAVLYSGVFATFCILLGATFINRRRGAASWSEAIPFGYKTAVLGAAGMLVGGAADALWHTFFGIEQNIDALFSPTHLWLMICSILIAIGPLRAMYHRKVEPVSLGDHLRLAFALTLFYAMLMVVAQATHPFLRFGAPLTAGISQGDEQLLAILGFIIQMCLFTGCALYVIRRWRLRFGFFTFVLTVASIGLAQLQGFELGIPISFVSGLAVDAAYYYLQPRLTYPLSLRLFAALASCALPAFYLLGLRLFYGPLIWTIHMVIGSVVVCGMFGWLLSYLMVPGQIEPTEINRSL